MPIERRSTGTQVRSILLAVVALAIAVGLGIALFRVATGRTTATTGSPGSGRFTVGNAAVLARNIERSGPFLLPDVSGNGQNRPIFVSHSGDDVTEGWRAFEARPPGGAADCFLAWDAAQARLAADCADATYPADGTGLTQYPTEVSEAGQVIVDLKPDR